MIELLRERGFRLKRCTWEITLACNLRCGHCGSRAGNPRADELSTEESFALIDQLARLGCRTVSLAGGEPTLRPDWDRLVARLRQRGVNAIIVSNGLTWDDALSARAKDAGIFRVAFSLDGLERTHDCLRRANEGYNKVLAAIDSCRRAGITVVAITTVMRDNLDELPRIYELLAARGVEYWQVQLGVPQGTLSDEAARVLRPEQILDLIAVLAELKARPGIPSVHPADSVGYFGEHEELLRGKEARIPFWVGCRAGIEVLGVESNGNVKGCLSLPSELNGRTEYIEGNVRARPLVEIWTDEDAFPYNRKFEKAQLEGACAGCDFGEICRGGCTFAAIGTCGHPHEMLHCYHLQRSLAD